MTVELVARCTARAEPSGVPCPGLLRFRWGMPQAACGTCGAWCGVAVADWLRVEPPAPPAHPPVELFVDHLAMLTRDKPDGVVVRCNGRTLEARPYWRDGR